MPQVDRLDGHRLAWLVKWIGAALLVVFAGLTTVDLTYPEADQFETDWQLYMRLAICGGCGLFGVLHLPWTKRHFATFPFAWCVLFAAWGLVTVPFALNPFYAAASWVTLSCVLVFAPAILLRLGGRRVVLAILTGIFAYVSWSWFAYFFVPEMGRYGFKMPDGEVIYRVGGNAQELGLQAAIATGLLLVLGLERSAKWRRLALPLVVAAGTLPFTQSRTAMVLMVAVIGIVYLRRLKTVWLFATGLVLAGALTLALLAGSSGLLAVDVDELAERFSRSGQPDEIYSMTGRTPIWEYAVERIRESPIIGYGYGNARQALADGAGGYEAFELHHAHNLLLNVLLCTGVVGGLLLLGMVVTPTLALLRRPAALADLALVIVLVAGLTEPVLFGPMPRVMTIVWFVGVLWRQTGASLDPGRGPAAGRVRHRSAPFGPGWPVAPEPGGAW